MVTEQYYFFWGGIFSQWYKIDMVIEGVTYNCCEQYMMAQKAIMFGDVEMLTKIMDTKNPRKQKGYGRKVKGYDDEKWNSNAQRIVFEGNLAKFTQNVDICKVLLTYDKEFVEASPHDTIWGIGLAESDPRALNKDTWLGTNWLGEAINKVRATILG